MDDRETLLEKLKGGGLVKVDRRKDVAIALQRERKLFVVDLAGDLYACLAPRSELSRLQESLARHKLSYRSKAPHPGRDEAAARDEADIARQFRAFGLSPSYPTGFL